MSEMQPTVSILCPIYNAERFIEQTMRSVLDQDYPNIELVLGDDCSTDGTLSIVRRIAAEYPARTTKILAAARNLGITANCNAVLGACSGKYVCFFAGDDLFYPGKLTAQVALMEATPSAVLSYHGIDLIDNDGQHLAIWEDTGSKYRTWADIIRRGGLPYNASVMVRRDAIPTTGFDASLPHVSDWLMLIEVAIRGEVLRLPGVHGAYRRHPGGVSRRTFDLLPESLRTLDVLSERYPSSEMTDACQAGRRRYLIGEVARSTLAGDGDRLRSLGANAASDGLVVAATLFGRMVAASGLPKAKAFRGAYDRLSKAAKS